MDTDNHTSRHMGGDGYFRLDAPRVSDCVSWMGFVGREREIIEVQRRREKTR